MRVAVLIDYDNLLEHQKVSGVLDVVTTVLFRLPKRVDAGRGICDIRVYGGWYEGEEMSNLAQTLSVSLQRDFPAIVRLPSASAGLVGLTVSAELAVALAEEPTHHLFNTFRKKGRPANIRVQSPKDVGCIDAACPLPDVKKLLKTGKCPMLNCGTTATDLIYRHEQKIVDTMLSCDLVYLSQRDYDHIVLVSGDDDFLPPLRTAILRGATIYRVHPTVSSQRVSLPVGNARLVELEL